MEQLYGESSDENKYKEQEELTGEQRRARALDDINHLATASFAFDDSSDGAYIRRNIKRCDFLFGATHNMNDGRGSGSRSGTKLTIGILHGDAIPSFDAFKLCFVGATPNES